jgi:putative addiction module CopG family antidote
MGESMNAQLTSENEQFIQEQIAAGRYVSPDEVVNAGLEMLRKRQALLSFIDEGRRQLDEGEYTEYDEDGLRRRFEELQERIDRN